MLFLSPFFLIKGFTQICELYSNHEIQDKESTEKHTQDKEWIIPERLFCVSHDVHHVCPTLKGDDLENIQNRHENIIKVECVLDWILVHQALWVFNFFIWKHIRKSFNTIMRVKAENHDLRLS